MFNLRQLVKQTAHISFRGRQNHFPFLFSASNAYKFNNKYAETAGGFLFDGIGDKKFPKVVSINKSFMMNENKAVSDLIRPVQKQYNLHDGLNGKDFPRLVFRCFDDALMKKSYGEINRTISQLIRPVSAKADIITTEGDQIKNLFSVEMKDDRDDPEPDDRNLPRVVDIDMDAMMEDLDDDPDIINPGETNIINSDLILPDDPVDDMLVPFEMDPTASEIKRQLRTAAGKEQKHDFRDKVVGNGADLADIKFPKK